MNLKKKIQNHNNFILGIDASNIKFGGGHGDVFGSAGYQWISYVKEWEE